MTIYVCTVIEEVKVTFTNLRVEAETEDLARELAIETVCAEDWPSLRENGVEVQEDVNERFVDECVEAE